MDSGFAWMLAAGAVAYGAWHYHQTKQPQARMVPVPTQTERYTQVGVNRTYLQPTLPKPADNSPLAPSLAKAVDPLVPQQGGSTEALPHADQEIKNVVQGVIHRVNVRSPNLGLTVVDITNVRKTVDSYKTIRYEADVGVHSTTKAYSSKIGIAVDMTAEGRTYIRAAKVHNAAKDNKIGGAAPSNGVGFEEKYATFEPAVRFM